MAVGGNLDVRKYFIVVLKTMSSRVKRSHDRVVLGVEAVVKAQVKKRTRSTITPVPPRDLGLGIKHLSIF